MELLMESGVQLGLGEGPIGIVGPMSQPRGNHWSLMLSRTSGAQWRFPSQLYSGQLRVTCILICRGAVSHRSRNGPNCFPNSYPQTKNDTDFGRQYKLQW